MSDHVACPQCGGVSRIIQNLRGRTLRCKRCGQIFLTEPPPPEAPEGATCLRSDAEPACASSTPRDKSVPWALPAEPPDPEPERRASRATDGITGSLVVWVVGGLAAFACCLSGGIAGGWLWWLTKTPPAAVSPPLHASGDSAKEDTAPHEAPGGPGREDFARPEAKEDPAKPQAKEPDNLIVNGSFEEGPEPNQRDGYLPVRKDSPAIRGWAVVAGEIDYKGWFWRAAEGKRSIDLNGSRKGAIGQTFATRPGQRYRVLFSLGGVHAMGSPLKKVVVSAAGQRNEIVVNTSDRPLKRSAPPIQEMGWTRRVWEFTAAAEETILVFSSEVRGANGAALDDVQVTLIPDR